MEVVLSPGRFGDEKPGVPFQREEVREWSHIDRLTGMLERARVETGRWQTSNQEAAKSYGKVVDSRERNSADGSVVQRARRQVEIFQSQGRGRSVQVVRASQWSSSRVTDSGSIVSKTLPVLSKTEEEIGGKDEERNEEFTISSRLETSENHGLRQAAISERLSALIGTFKYNVSSTVPLRRIDSKYSSRASISTSNARRRNSSEDLASMSREKTVQREEKTTTRMEDRSRMNEEKSVKIELRDDDSNPRDISPMDKLNRHEKCWKNEISSIVDNDEKSRSKKWAIKLLPSSRSNRTVVNLMNDGITRGEAEIHDGNGANVNWTLPISIGNTSETRTPETKKKTVDETPTIDASSYRKNPKRVGFSKTEIHFAADSGKVNIVETDEKPPPTNKFRRRRRSAISTSDKISPICGTASHEAKKNDGPITDLAKNRSDLDDVTKNELQRCHTTTVKLGNEISKTDERGSKEAFSHGILLRLENRIYDRLEAYSSDIRVDSSVENNSNIEASTRTDVQALKSARLVLNLTRRPERTLIANDCEISRIHDDDEKLIDIAVDPTRRNNDDTKCHCLDWKKEDERRIVIPAREDQRTMLDDRKIDVKDFVAISATNETESIGDSDETMTIAKENNEKLDKSEVNKNTEDCDVVCTDAENNRVVLKVVTTHEPTLARVENDHVVKASKKPTIGKKSSARESMAIRKKPQVEHTYANVFTGSSNAPIYENYKIADSNERKTGKVCDRMKRGNKLSGMVEEKMQLISQKELENSNLTKKKFNIAEKSPEKSDVVENGGDKKSLAVKKKSSIDSSSSSTKNSGENSRSRTRKISRNPTIRPVVKSQISLRSNERDSRIPDGVFNRDEKIVPSKSTSTASSTSTKNNKETRRKPMEVVYQTAVYNMRNEKLSKPQKGKESRGPRYLNELICGAKTKRPSVSRSKTSGPVQHTAHSKSVPQTVRHWK